MERPTRVQVAEKTERSEVRTSEINKMQQVRTKRKMIKTKTTGRTTRIFTAGSRLLAPSPCLQGVSEKLGTLIEGESLLNDGSAIVVFEVFLGQSRRSLAAAPTCDITTKPSYRTPQLVLVLLLEREKKKKKTVDPIFVL